MKCFRFALAAPMIYAALAVVLISCPGKSLGGGTPGVQGFTADGTWIAPKGISVVEAEMWGAGGGSSPNTIGISIGGSGEFVRTRVRVKGGTAYTVKVGKGGTPSNAVGTAGIDGGATQLVSSSGQVLISSEGGKGGISGAATVHGSGTIGGGYRFSGVTNLDAASRLTYGVRSALGGSSADSTASGTGHDGFVVLSW